MNPPKIQIGNKLIGAGNNTFFIAEVASAHEGDFTVAQKMIDAAVEAKADAVKFQILQKEAYMVPYHPIYPIVEQIEFSPAQWKNLRDYATTKNILFLVDCCDGPSCELAAELNVDALKVHSSDLSNPELIESVARKNKPIFLGVGGTTMDEIGTAVSIIRKYHNNIILMHGYQAFPTKLEEINFNFVKTIKTAFNLPVGILDHTEGETFMSKLVPLLTPFVDADVVEKHFTLDRSRKGIDYESSVNPDTLKAIVENLRLIESTKGRSEPPVSFSVDEQKYRNLMKKTIVANNSIMTGTIITREMISFKRAGKGLKPSEAYLILGKKVKHNLPKNEIIMVEDLE